MLQPPHRLHFASESGIRGFSFEQLQCGFFARAPMMRTPDDSLTSLIDS